MIELNGDVIIKTMKWKKISSEEIFSHPRLKLVEDTVELPNGVERKYLTFGDTMDVVTVICKNNQGQFLIQKEMSYPHNEMLFQFPGGKLDYGESPEDGANRELSEEASLFANSLELLGKYLTNNRRSKSWMHVFLATNLRKRDFEADIDEEFEDFWMDENQIDDLITKGEIVNVNMLASWCLFKLK